MRRLGITGKFVFHSAWILIALGSAVTAYFVYQLRDLHYQDMVKRVEAQALNWIQANISTLVVFLPQDRRLEKKEGIKYVPPDLNIDRLIEEQGIAYAILLDNKQRGRLRSLHVPEGLVQQAPAEKVPGAKSQLRNQTDNQGHRYFELATPIPASGTGMNPGLEAMFAATAKEQIIGELRIGVDREAFEHYSRLLVWRNVPLAAVLVLLAVVASLMFARRIVKPIVQMGRVANQISGGNLGERVQHGAELRDEVGDLVRNFNQMGQRLQESQEEMKLLHSRLEEKVRQRTVQLEEANRRLQQLDQLKSDFVSEAAHELRTPLTSIKAYAENLLDARSPDPERQKRDLGIINEESDRMTRLISNLLDLTRIESGIFPWRMSSADLSTVVRKTRDLLIPHALERHIQLNVIEAEPQLVWADAECIRQVITNLVDNAIKFSFEGGQVEIRLDRVPASRPHGGVAGKYVQVVVTDTGPGIPPEECEKVFERFYQGPKNRSVRSGAGLGLAICKQIVLHHKGEIWVESELGAGSRFGFTVPLYQPASL